MEIKSFVFDTSQGGFIVIDVPKDSPLLGQYLVEKYGAVYYTVADISEEDAGDIVDWNELHQYYYKHPSKAWEGDITAIESLHSLLRSFGMELFKNPYEGHEDEDLEWFYNQITFFNPLIWKLS